jgi:uncharacterized membrane protein
MNLKTILHDTFRTGITMKGIDGVVEAIGGVLLWFVKPSKISGPLKIFFAHELSRDPHDFVAKHLLHLSDKLATSDATFASLFLLSHGVVKVVLVTCLWLDKLWAYPATIVVFGAFCVYQMYRFTHTHSIALVLLTIFDLGLILLTWHEYQEQKQSRSKSHKK